MHRALVVLGRLPGCAMFCATGVVLLSVCGGKAVDSAGGTKVDAGSGMGAADLGASGAGGAEEAEGGTASGADGTVGERSADSGSGLDGAEPALVELPSRQTVTFNLRNGASEKWVVTRGSDCAPFVIEGLRLIPAYNCLCECSPPTQGATYLAYVAPNEKLVVTWDARQWVTWMTLRDCATLGWSGRPPATEVHSVMQPVEAGIYRATFGYEEAPPSGLQASSCQLSGQDYSCEARGPGFPVVPADNKICSSAKTVQQDFVLPGGGDVLVDVNLN
jgi:hypothetical protein